MASTKNKPTFSFAPPSLGAVVIPPDTTVETTETNEPGTSLEMLPPKEPRERDDRIYKGTVEPRVSESVWPHRVLRYTNEFFTLAKKISALTIIIVSAYLIMVSKSTQNREENMLELLQHLPREFIRQLPSELRNAKKTYIFLPLFSASPTDEWKRFLGNKELVEIFGRSAVFFDTNLAPLSMTTIDKKAEVTSIGTDGSGCDTVLRSASGVVFLHDTDQQRKSLSNLGLFLTPQVHKCYSELITPEYSVWYLKPRQQIENFDG